MGGIVSSLFGGSKQTQQQTSSSSNKAYDKVSSALDPALGYVTQGGNALSALLGLTGGGDQAAAKANFRNTPGYQFQLEQGQDAITTSGFAKGLGNSGATLKGLTKYGQGLADSTYQSYIQNLLGLSNLGNQSAGNIVNAGQISNSSGSSSGSSNSGGLGKALGFGLSLLGSDRRLKTDIREVGEHLGMKVYTFKYIGDDQQYKGLMAQEILEHYPEAVQPVGGFLAVDYSLVPNSEDIQYA